MALPPTFLMSSNKVRPQLPLAFPASDDDNIIVSWNDGIVNSSIDEKLRAKSKSTGLQHAMDILGESTHSKFKTIPYSSFRERATDETSSAKLPPLIDPGDILEPNITHPQEWDKCSTSESQLHSTTQSINDRNDQQSVEMILPTSRNDLTCVATTNILDNTDLSRSEQFDQQNLSPTVLDASTRTTVWPDDSNMIKMIESILASESPCPDAPDFCFEMTLEAAEKNFLVLKHHDFDLGKAIEAQSTSPVGYGSEFRKTGILSPLLRNHPFWPMMKSILENGAEWPMDPISEESCIADVKEALLFENHKGAISQPELLMKLVTGDVIHGYSLPLPLDKIKRLPHVCMAPLNIQAQWTINERGEIIPKDRLTHDQSYKWEHSGTSVNSRCDSSSLPHCMFGKCLLRIINWAVAARRKYPNCRIFAKKDDFKSAYRRCHLHWLTACKTVTQIEALSLAFMNLRLTFGGSLCPNFWCLMSELMCDLVTAILHNDEWDPTILFGRNQHLVPPPRPLDDDIPFGEGRELIVDIEIDPRGMNDVYIDDVVSLTVKIEGTDNLIRCERAPLLMFDTCSRPLADDEPIPRETMEARNKLESEAMLEETKMILGWLLDFRRLLIILPDNKFTAWMKAIEDIIHVGSATAKILETNIGRLTHLGMAIPSIHHFMSRLRDLHSIAKRRRSVKINGEYLEDLKLMLKFLKIANTGISFNTIAFRRPTHVYRSDSCPAGLGGYSHEGFAWRWYLPEDLKFRATNNLLEHLAAIVSPWVDILAGRLKSQDCVLSMTDSTTAEGWLRKSNFSELGESKLQASVRIEAARMQATLFMSLEIKSYSQWFRGELNDVSDSLSRDDDKTDDELISIYRSSCPSQIPRHFEIVPLPSEIISWLTALLQKLPVNQQYREVHTRSKLWRGNVGASTTVASETTTSSLNHSPSIRESNSLEPLPWLCEKDGFRDQLMTDWLKAQSQVPFHMYARPSEKTASRTPHSTTMPGLVSFYNDSIVASKTQIQRRSTKRPSQCLSSPKSDARQLRSSRSQFRNSPASPSSSLAGPANTSKYQQPTNAEQQSFAFATSDSSETVNSLPTKTTN